MGLLITREKEFTRQSVFSELVVVVRGERASHGQDQKL
jgi:hypothetical protein